MSSLNIDTWKNKGIVNRINYISDNTNLSMDTKPVTCKIEVSGTCNLDCRFCNHSNLKDRFKLMSLKDFEEVINFVHKNYPSITDIGLFLMGEPGLNRELPEMYKMVKNIDRNYFTFLTTNGLFIKYITKSLQFVDSLKVSWNYKNEKDFEEKTDTSIDAYYDIRRNIKRLYKLCKEYNTSFSISTVIDEKNDKKEDYYKSIEGFEYDYHYFLPLQTQGGYVKDAKGGCVGNDSRYESNPIPCYCLFKGLYIDVNKNIRICPFGNEEHHIIGNIYNGIDMNYYNKIKEQHLYGSIPKQCEKCLNS